MLDTVRFKTYCNPDLWAEIEAAKQTVKDQKKNNFTDTVHDVLYSSVLVPPFSNKVSIMAYDYHDVYIECSLPKIEFGNNVQMLYPSQIVDVLRRIQETLVEQFGSFPQFEGWELQRVDPCYNFKFSPGEAARIMKILRNFELPRMNMHIYKNETVSFTARTTSVNFYLKHNEFKKRGKDYDELRAKGFQELAEEILVLSEGVVRLEIELKRAKLVHEFGKKTINYTDLLDINFYYKILNKYLERLLKTQNKESMYEAVICDLLVEAYGKVKGSKLFIFNHAMRCNPLLREAIKSNTNATTIARNLKEISAASVGISVDDPKLHFDLSIPNKNVVTPEPAPSALAEELPEKEINIFDVVEKKEREQLPLKV